MTNAEPNRASWVIVFDHAGLSAADVRMLSAVVDADLRLMRLAHDSADGRADEALVRQVRDALSIRFPHVAFRLICIEQDDA